MLDKIKEYALSEIVMDEYFHLCGRAFSNITSYQFPYIGEIIKETWQTKDIEIQEKTVQEAVFRREFETLGLSKSDFITLALSNNLQSFEIPVIPVTEVAYEVHLFLSNKYIAYTDYDGLVVNSPLGREVW